MSKIRKLETNIINNNCSIKLILFSDFFPTNKRPKPIKKEMIKVVTYELILKK